MITSYPGAVQDLSVRPIQPPVVQTGVNTPVVDPAFPSTVIKRLTNATVGATPGSSHRNLSSEQACSWRADELGFVATTPSGAIEYFAFDPVKVEATFRYQLPFTNEPTFSRVRPTICYGAVGYQVVAIDVETLSKTVIWDLAKTDPAYAVSGLYLGGSVQSSASQVEKLVVFYGGSGADKHFRVAVFNVDGSGLHVYDTVAKTVDGQAVTVDASFHVHAIGMDKSGRFVIVYPTGGDQTAGAAPMYVWDQTTGAITANRTFPWGHDCTGWGTWVNNSGDLGLPYDAFQYGYRSLMDLTTVTRIINPQLLPKLTNSDGHPQWNNARPDVVTPFWEATMRFYEDTPRNLETDPTHRVNTVAWRPWDNEIGAIHPSGAWYRFCHHFCDIYADDGRTMNFSFWYQPLVQVSPSGRFGLFVSNMLKTLGLDPKEPNPSTRYRTDLFVIDTQPGAPIVSTTTPTSGVPFTVTVSGDGVDTTSYDLAVNGTSQGPKPAPATWTLTLASGTYSLTGTAIGPGGTSAPATLSVTVAPGKPHTPTVTLG